MRAASPTSAFPTPGFARAAKARSSTPTAATAAAAAICSSWPNDMTDVPNETPPPAEAPPPRRRFQFRRPTRRTVFRTISWTVGIGFILFIGVIFWAYRSAVGRFEVRRLRLPTRIYADYTPLTVGMALQPDDLLEKLDRLGYREVEHVAQSGEYARAGNAIDIFTREFRHPTGEYKAQQVHVVLAKSQIESVSDFASTTCTC